MILASCRTIAQIAALCAAVAFSSLAVAQQPGQANLDAQLTELDRVIEANKGKNLQRTTEAMFERAGILEKQNAKEDVRQTYDGIVRENRGKDNEQAAEALYRQGAFILEAKGETETGRRAAMDAAHTTWVQLRNDYPDTLAGRKLLSPSAEFPDGAMKHVENLIDRRNSADWKYQVMDSLVKLTGKNPSYSYALALILLAVMVKVLLLPLTKKQYASMREMQRMQPLIKELQKKYKQQELSQKTMELYKEHGVNPFGGCLPAVVQIPFLIVIFNAIREYEIAFGAGHFLWIGSKLATPDIAVMGYQIVGANLGRPDIILLALYAVTNWVTMKMTPASDPQQQQQQNTMALMTSVLFFVMFIQYKWSSAFVLYWFALNLLSIYQQYEYIYKPHKARQSAEAAGGALAAAAGSGVVIESDAVSSGTSAERPRVRPRRKKR